ncbi:MAG: hypothetical protein C5B43_02015 [Verrucomicrobia bacterium]|nr:MAG: hypothetical protein C5B43_02015 [Verrucomicrobiota bacterium]
MRKKFLSLAALGFAFLTQTLSADVCSICGWYAGASGSVAWHRNTRLSNFRTVEYKTGYGGNISVGFLFDSVWRLELEGVFRFYDNDCVHSELHKFSKTNNGHLREFAGLINLLYDIPICDCLDIYVGGGLGVGQTHLKQIDRHSPPFSETDNARFAFQFLSGFALDINDCWALTLGYRYFSMLKPKFCRRIDDSEVRVVKRPYSNNVDLGLRYKF